MRKSVPGYSRILPWIAEEDAEQGEESHDHGVKEVGDDAGGRDGGKAGGHQHLCSIGDEALCKATEGVEETGTLATIDPKAGGNIVGNGAGGHDGDGIVGGAYIGEHDKGGNGQFGSTFALDTAGELLHDVVDAAIVADEFEHTPCQQGDDDEFAHAHDAFAHGVQPTEEIVTAEADAHDAREGETNGEYQHDIHAAQGGDEYYQVGDDLVPFDGFQFGGSIDGQS